MLSEKPSQPPLTLESIESAINQIDAKKESLKRAFEELQSQTSLFPSLSLSWSDLDAHFTVVQHTLSHQYRLLQSLENSQQLQSSSPSSGSGLGSTLSARVYPNEGDPSKYDPEDGNPSGSKADFDGKKSVLSRVDPINSKADPENGKPSGSKVHRDGKNLVLSHVDSKSDLKNGDTIGDNTGSSQVELRGLCERMDGDGLREYIFKGWEERDRIRVELVNALDCASDPALLVLNSIERFYGKGKIGGTRGKICEILLETLVEVRNVEVGGEVRERAKRLVLEWKKKEVKKQEIKNHLLGLLKLTGAFRLKSELSLEEFVDHLIDAKPRQASKLCHHLGFGDKIIDIIQKLLSKNAPLLALKLVLNFELTDMFPPATLLNSYIRNSKMRAQKVCEEGKNAPRAEKVAISLELSALKAVVKFIEVHNLESEYPRADIEKLIDQLEKQITDKKRPAAAPALKHQQLHQASKQHKEQKEQQQPLQSGNKRPRMISPVEPREILPLHQSHPGLAGLLPDRHAQYLSAPAVPYGLAGSAHSFVPQTGISVGLYGSVGTSAGIYGSAAIPADIYGNQVLSSSELHSSEFYMPSGYYDRLTAHGGYGAPPQYYR